MKSGLIKLSDNTETGYKLIRIDGNGRISLPADMRETLGIKIGDYVKVILEEKAIVIRAIEISERG